MAPTPINKRVQQPRNLTSVLDQYVGPNGQVVWDVERRSMRIHDGKKKGGWEFPNITALRKIFLGRESEFAGLEFPAELTGFVARTADRIYRLREIATADGLTVLNPDGVAGDPTIGLPPRLKAEQVVIPDADDALDTGFYVIQKGADSNTPAEFLTVSDTTLEVINYRSTVGGTVLQIARAAQLASANVYTRRLVVDIWSDWIKREDPAIPDAPNEGTLAMLINGVDEIPRLWSAAEVSNAVRRWALEQIQFINGANAAQAFSFNQLYMQAGIGAVSTQQIAGPFTFVTNDRYEIVASATAVKGVAGDAQNARVEVEKTDLTWDVIGNLAVVIGPNEDTKSDSIIVRIVKTANGYTVMDSNWAVLSTVVAILTGRFRVTVGTVDQSGARVARYR